MNYSLFNTSYSLANKPFDIFMHFEHSSNYTVHINQQLAFYAAPSNSYKPQQIVYNFDEASMSYSSYCFNY